MPLLDPWSWVERVRRDDPDYIALEPVGNAGDALARLPAQLQEEADADDDPSLASAQRRHRVEVAIQT